jgi:predicted TIM-barrel fold metal-dependent hydrolase
VRSFTILFALLIQLYAAAQSKIIDMHIHSYTDKAFDEQHLPIDYYGVKGAANAKVHRTQTFTSIKKLNISRAVVSGSPQSVDEWVTHDTARLIIRGILMYSPADYGIDSTTFEQMVKDHRIEVFGEIAPYYTGTTLNDSAWQPFLRICEKYDIPVAVHTGGGDPGGTYSWAPQARLKFGDPYLIEDVLVKYPKLRIYMMHAGEDWHEHALRLMAYYPQLYTDIAAMLWVEPLDQQFATEFLKAAKHAGYLNRVMFGSDQMMWPYAIEKSVDFLNSLNFLTRKDKEDIFYNNARRFLKLK